MVEQEAIEHARSPSSSLPEPTGRSSGIPNEWTGRQPPWISIEQRDETTEHGVTLKVHDLSINPQALTDESGLTEAEIALLSRYDTRIRVWSPEAIANWYAVAAQPQTSLTLLAEGLASNHTQWTRQGNSFVHRWHTYIKSRIKPILPPAQQNLTPITLAISCPGFGGSALRDESRVTTDDISDHTYARYIDALVKLLRIPSNKAIAAGHSAGGEALLTWVMGSEFSTTIPIVALHPAVGSSFQRQFSLLGSAQAIAGKVTGLLRGIKLTATEILLRTILDISLTDPLSPPQTHQIYSHMYELDKHRKAFQAKLKELARARPPDPTRLEEMAALPLTLTGSRDKLTPRETLREWLDAAFLTKHLAKFGLVFPELAKVQHAIAENLKALIETSGPWGHVAIFTDETAQQKAVELLRRQLELQLSTNWPVFREVHDIIRYLHSQQFPIRLAYNPNGKGIYSANTAYVEAQQQGLDVLLTLSTREWNFRSRLEQAETLCRWAEVQDILEVWEKKYCSQESHQVIIPADEIDQLFRRLFNLHGARPYYKYNYEEFKRVGNEEKSKVYEKGYPAVSADTGVSLNHLNEVNNLFFDTERRIECAHLNDWIGDPELLYHFKSGVVGVVQTLLVAYESSQGVVETQKLKDQIHEALKIRFRGTIEKARGDMILAESGLKIPWERTISAPVITVNTQDILILRLLTRDLNPQTK